MSQGMKRKRTGPHNSSRKRQASSDKVGSSRSGPVKGQDLRWKEVAVSKRLDDAEGFYGLEELSDVEVVQDADGRGVSFRPLLEDVKGTDVEPEHAEEWTGFDGDDQAVLNDHKDLSSESVTQRDDPNSNKTVKKSSISADLSESVNFSVLDSEIPEPEVDMTEWQSLNLSQALIYAISALRFASPTQIQRLAIPQIMLGKDVIGKAVTGSGKTLAFGVPIIEDWLDKRIHPEVFDTQAGPIALILAPTRELAHQISKHLSAICEGLDNAPRIATVT